LLHSLGQYKYARKRGTKGDSDRRWYLYLKETGVRVGKRDRKTEWVRDREKEASEGIAC
jgi:hypothetical protein